ncbi:MAG: hypothetical protein WAT12_15755 [Candidatus Nitrotoga sp.]
MPCRVATAFPVHCGSLDASETFDTKLEVFPRRADITAVEAGHVEQHPQLSVLSEESLEYRNEVCVIVLYQLAADMNGEQLAVIFFIELYGYRRLFILGPA